MGYDYSLSIMIDLHLMIHPVNFLTSFIVGCLMPPESGRVKTKVSDIRINPRNYVAIPAV